jgi:hypothetical protein
LSYYVRSGANYSGGSNAYITLGSGTGTDQQLGNTGFTGFSTVAANNSITPTSTWTRYSITGTVSSSAMELGLEIGYTPTGTAGANDFIEVTGIQLDEGSVALPYRRASSTLQGELAAASRYYYRIPLSTYSYSAYGSGLATSTTAARIYVQFPVMMRTIPTSIDAANLAITDFVNYTSAATVTIDNLNTLGGSVNAATTGLTQYRPAILVNSNNTTGYLGFSAEL